MSKEEVKRKVAEKVECDWRWELEEKSTLWLYRMNKREMSEEDYGGPEDTVLFRARTICLWLGDKNRQEGEQLCKICGGGMREDLEHFLLECCEVGGGGATEAKMGRVIGGDGEISV